jgi:hypothetical protein
MMTNLIPWERFEEEYAKSFSENKGAPALPFRVALVALIIQERLGISEALLNQGMNANCASYPKVSLGLGFKNPTRDDSYLKSATPKKLPSTVSH